MTESFFKEFGYLKIIFKVPKRKEGVLHIFDKIIVTEFNYFPNNILEDSKYYYYVWVNQGFVNKYQQSCMIRMDYRYKSNTMATFFIALIGFLLIIFVTNILNRVMDKWEWLKE